MPSTRNIIVRIAAVVLAAIALFALFRTRAQITEKEKEVNDLQTELTQTNQEIQQLEEATAALETEQGIKDVARNKLDLAEQGEIIFKDVGD